MDPFGRWALLTEIHSFLIPNLPIILFIFPIISLLHHSIPRLQPILSPFWIFRLFVSFLVFSTIYLMNAFLLIYVVNEAKRVWPLPQSSLNLITFLSSRSIPPLLIIACSISLIFFFSFTFRYFIATSEEHCKSFLKALLFSFILPSMPTIVSTVFTIANLQPTFILQFWIGSCTVIGLIFVYFFMRLSAKFRGNIVEKWNL